MTTSQKAALSLLVSVILFGVFTALSFTGLFDLIEARFYNPSITSILTRDISNNSIIIDRYFNDLQAQFQATLNESAIKRSFLPNQSAEDIYERSRIYGLLIESTGGLQWIRFVDSGGSRLHYSTYNPDILYQDRLSVSYRNYNEDGFPYESVASYDGVNPRLIFDENSDRILFSFPFYDSFEVFRGTALFSLSVRGVSDMLISSGRIKAGQDISIISDPPGLLSGMGTSTEKAAAPLVANIWKEGGIKVARLESPDSGLILALISEKTDRFFVGRLVDEQIFSFPQAMKIILLASFFLTIYLTIFLVLNIRQDSVTIVQNRLKQLQISLIEQYYDRKGDIDWNRWRVELEQRRDEIRIHLKKGIKAASGGEKDDIDLLIDKSWDELLAVIGGRKDSSIDEEKLEVILNRILAALPAAGTKGAVSARIAQTTQPAGITAAPSSSEEAVEDLEEISEAEAVEDLEEIAEAEAVEDLEEIAEAEAVEDLEEVAEAEAVEDLEEVAVAEAVEDLEEIAEAEAVEDLEEVAVAEAVEDLEEVAVAEAVEELEEIAVAEAVEELEEITEAQSAGDMEEISEPELIEFIEPVEDEEKLELIEAASDTELFELTEADGEAYTAGQAPATEDDIPIIDAEAFNISESMVDDALQAFVPDAAADLELVGSTQTGDIEELEELEDVEEAEEIEELEELEEPSPHTHPGTGPDQDYLANVASEIEFSPVPEIDNPWDESLDDDLVIVSPFSNMFTGFSISSEDEFGFSRDDSDSDLESNSDSDQNRVDSESGESSPDSSPADSPSPTVEDEEKKNRILNETPANISEENLEVLLPVIYKPFQGLPKSMDVETLEALPFDESEGTDTEDSGIIREREGIHYINSDALENSNGIEVEINRDFKNLVDSIIN